MLRRWIGASAAALLAAIALTTPAAAAIQNYQESPADTFTKSGTPSNFNALNVSYAEFSEASDFHYFYIDFAGSIKADQFDDGLGSWAMVMIDSNNDGIGDFPGLIAKLDYIADLGVNTIWLLPFYPSPRRDDGYDIAEYRGVHSDYGTMADAKRFIAEAHKRDIKVILDLVLNHISDKHDWFIKSANKEAGYEDYFIWRDERPASGWGQPWSSESNPAAIWHWNETRNAYYYGAFGSSQPDLNLTKQVVIDELNKLATFWLEKGVDGFRYAQLW